MKNRWLFCLYNALVVLTLPFILLGVAIRWRKRFARGLDHSSERWGHLSKEKLAKFQASGGGWWWVHAASLGEVKSIEPFLKRIPQEAKARVLLSVVTPEALQWASDKQLADEIIAAPIDLPWTVRRVSQAVQAKLFISVESEFWPNLLREAKRSGAKVALVNGRISVRSYKRYKYIRSILPAIWDSFDLVAVRQKEDEFRFSDLGVAQALIHVTGNMKYDLLPASPLKKTTSNHATHLTLVVGSSREGEEKELLPTFERLRLQFPDLHVIWAPRHIERVGEIESLLQASGLKSARKSLRAGDDPAPYLLWDTMGDLLEAYAQSDVAVIGGSFVPKGGQNPLEPAALSVPVVFGPSMENFHGISEVLVAQGGARQVTLSALEGCLTGLLSNKETRETMGRRGRESVESQQGATDRSLALLKGLVHA